MQRRRRRRRVRRRVRAARRLLSLAAAARRLRTRPGPALELNVCAPLSTARAEKTMKAWLRFVGHRMRHALLLRARARPQARPSCTGLAGRKRRRPPAWRRAALGDSPMIGERGATLAEAGEQLGVRALDDRARANFRCWASVPCGAQRGGGGRPPRRVALRPSGARGDSSRLVCVDVDVCGRVARA